MAKRIVITGATGLTGLRLCRALFERGYEVSLITRNQASAKKKIPFAVECVKWEEDFSGDYSGLINGSEAVINLAGASVLGQKWTEEYKTEILKSRIISTRSLVKSIGQCNDKPRVFICASAIGYYGNRGNEVITEKSTPGTDFLSSVCVHWEKEAQTVEQFGVRWVSLRTGIVLDKNGGALGSMLKSFRLFAGGYLGDGEHWFSWIHWKDLCAIYIYAIENDLIKGGVNATAPISDNMAEFARTLGRVLHRPSFFPVPEFILRLILGEGVTALVSSQRVLPACLNRAGFKFEFVKAEEAFKNILNS